MSIPSIGFGVGTARYCGPQHNIDETEVSEELVGIVHEALKVGYCHLDLAEMYGNDRECAIGLHRFLETSPKTRESLWITSKLHEHIEEPKLGVEAIIKRLNCSYLDLLLLHCPTEFLTGRKNSKTDAEIWKELELLVSCGLVRHIGVSNYRKSDLEKLLSFCTIRPFINQVEFNPYLQQPLLQNFCVEQSILMAAYSPLGPLNLWPGGPVDTVLTQIASAHQMSTSAVLLRYTQQKGYIVLSTSKSRERMVDALASVTPHGECGSGGFAFTLSAEEISEIDGAGLSHFRRKYWQGSFPENTDAGSL